ncbi:MAG: hypothetical protein JXA30_11575 [Deltaproteobacteria bacterium]|nr:hypothetical protein [Deltaproteobacteria bacterium]
MKPNLRIGLFYLTAILSLANCDRFPRDNPIDPANTNEEKPEIALVEQPTIDDALEYDGWNNRNGMAEPGETVRFMVELMNRGGKTATGVSASISSASDCVFSAAVRGTIGNRAPYGDIEPGEISPLPDVASSFYYEVVLSTDECVGVDTVRLSLNARDSTAKSWEIPLELEIERGDADFEIAQDGIRIEDDLALSACNNNNRRIERGEKIHLVIPIRNTAVNSYARNVSARLTSSASECIRFPEGDEDQSKRLAYGDIAPGALSRATDQPDYFVVETLKDTCPVEGQQQLSMLIEDVSDRSRELPFGMTFFRSDVNIAYYSHSIDDSPVYLESNDDDGEADPGEVVRFAVVLVNNGRTLARSVDLVVDNEQDLPSCISRLSIRGADLESLSYGDIEPDTRSVSQADGGYLEVVLSQEQCSGEYGEEIVLRAMDGCRSEWEIRVPLTTYLSAS